MSTPPGRTPAPVWWFDPLLLEWIDSRYQHTDPQPELHPAELPQPPKRAHID